MPAPSPGTQPSRRRSNGRQARDGSPSQRDIWSSRLIRTRLSGWIFESAPPVIITSARPRAMIRAASPIARFDAASASVIVLLGPWQSSRIEMWQASMFGRYFSSQIGSIMPIALAAPDVVVEAPVGLRGRASIAGASSSSSVEIRPAPRSTPIRVGSTPPSARPASAMASCGRGDGELDVAGHVLEALAAAPCWMLGQGRSLQESKSADLGADVVGQAVDGERLDRADRALRPRPATPRRRRDRSRAG